MIHSFSYFANQRGQATTAALVILPVALSVFCALIVAAYAISFEARSTAACRASLLDSQTNAAEALHELLALNKEAKIARNGVMVAKAAVRMARFSGFPLAIAAAEATLFGAKTYETFVYGRQQWHLRRGQFYSKSATFTASNAIRETLPPGFFGRAVLKSFAVPELKHAKFRVLSHPPGARTPTYRTAPDFERSQKASAKWLLKVDGGETAMDGPSFTPRIEFGCAVKLTKRKDGKWYPQIFEDKLMDD